jgi:hypothetical protein
MNTGIFTAIPAKKIDPFLPAFMVSQRKAMGLPGLHPQTAP